MTELDKLLEWMEKNNHSRASLANAIGMSYDGITQILYVRRRLSPGFKLRFIQCFGQETAKSIFEPSEKQRISA